VAVVEPVHLQVEAEEEAPDQMDCSLRAIFRHDRSPHTEQLKSEKANQSMKYFMS
jgi:hypothetical protein